MAVDIKLRVKLYETDHLPIRSHLSRHNPQILDSGFRWNDKLTCPSLLVTPAKAGVQESGAPWSIQCLFNYGLLSKSFPFRGSPRLSLLFRPVPQDYVVHNIATADTSPAIKIIGLAVKPFVIHETTALCAFHGWPSPLRRFLPAKKRSQLGS